MPPTDLFHTDGPHADGRRRHPRAPRRLAAVLAVGLAGGLAGGLGGCVTSTQPATTAERHPVGVDVVAGTLALGIDPASGALDTAERLRAAEVLAAQAGDTAPHVTVTGQPLAPPARRTVTALLGEAGVTAEDVAFAPDGTPGTTLRLTRYVAVAPECRRWGDIGDGWFENAPTGILGCSNQRNLALMLADPRDLLEGRGTRPADGARMAGSVQRYRTDQVKKLPSEKGGRSVLFAPALAAPAMETP